MREPNLQRITFLGFKIFKIFQILKLLSGIIYLIFMSLFHFRPMFSFFYQRIEVQKRKSARKTFRCFSLLSKNIEKISIYLEDDQQIQLILPDKFSRDMGKFLFARWKKLHQYFTLCYIPFTVKEFLYTFFTFPNTHCMTSLIKRHE